MCNHNINEYIVLYIQHSLCLCTNEFFVTLNAYAVHGLNFIESSYIFCFFLSLSLTRSLHISTFIMFQYFNVYKASDKITRMSFFECCFFPFTFTHKIHIPYTTGIFLRGNNFFPFLFWFCFFQLIFSSIYYF